jgi:hypothetical protein
MKRLLSVGVIALFLAVFGAIAQAPNSNHLTVSWSYLADTQHDVSVIATYDNGSLNIVQFILIYRMPNGEIRSSYQYVPTGPQASPPGVQGQSAVAFPTVAGTTVVQALALGFKWSGDVAQ